MWKEAVMAGVWLGVVEENDDNPQAGSPVSAPRFESSNPTNTKRGC
jgi:hypothetical protein